MTAGFIYLCTPTFERMLHNSIASLLRVDPNAKFHVLCTHPMPEYPHTVLPIEEDYKCRRFKTSIYQYSPFDITFYLDCDTVFVRPVDIPAVLRNKDMMLALDPYQTIHVAAAYIHNENHVTEEEIEETIRRCGRATPFFNGGAFIFRKNPRVQAVFDTWHSEWLRYGRSDQFAFARAIRKKCAVVSRLPQIYNQFVLNEDDAIPDDSAVLHFINGGRESLMRARGYWDCPFRIITAADATFKPILKKTRAASAKIGYDVLPYNIRGLGFGRKFNVPEIYKGYGRTGVNQEIGVLGGICPWKPSLIQQALTEAPAPVVWMDADMWIIRPLDLTFSAFDIAVTMRRPHERGGTIAPDIYGYLNAGFVAVNNTQAAREFVALWVAEVEAVPSHSDQHALNNLVRRATDLSEYNKVFTWQGVRILVLRTEEYNFIHAPEEPLPETKVIHFKADIRQQVSMDEWLLREWP